MTAVGTLPDGLLTATRREVAARVLAGPDRSPRAALMIVLTFLPYVAIPVGNNTNVPVAALCTLLFVRELLTVPRLLVPALALAVTPAVMLFVQLLLGVGEGTEVSAILWMIQVAPFAGVAAAVLTAPHTVRVALRWSLLASAVYGIVQKYYLDQGVLPFVDLYDMPGYWSVPDNAETIAAYVHRPFSWFPEPSFMAGTLALGALALMLLGFATRRRLPAVDLFTVAVVVAVMVLSQSGSALLTIPVLAAVALLPFASPLQRTVCVLGGAALCLVLTLGVLQARDGADNHSWGDRLASIVAGMQHLFDSAQTLLLGVGVGGASILYQNYLIPLDGLVVSTRLFDIFSVTARIVLANGIVAGVAMVFVLVVPLMRAFSLALSWWYGLLAVFAWAVVSTVTITYDSAAWIWALPGVCLGVLVAVSEEPMRNGAVRS